MIKILFFVLFFVKLTFSECVPARQEISLPSKMENYPGSYFRIHPTGNYILASGVPINGSSVVMIDLTKKNKNNIIEPKLILTSMNNEAYPVEGSWKLFASPNHDGWSEMQYYGFNQVLDKQKKATSLFSDREHNQFYHSSAELPGSTTTNIKFRTLLWQKGLCKDYELVPENGKLVNKSTSKQYRLCQNLYSENGDDFLGSPILSKDGTEVAARNDDGHAVIYKIADNGDCSIEDDLGYSTSKVNFSYPKKDSKGQIVFAAYDPTGGNSIHIYDRDKKVTKKLSQKGDNSRGTPGYPGMTLDGRVVFIANSTPRKIVIVDPSQLNDDGSVKSGSADPKTCIQIAAQSGVNRTEQGGIGI